MGYSIEMKEAVITKVLMGGKPHHEIAREAGIGRSTIACWLKHYKKDGNTNLKKQEKRPQDWTAEERIDALMATGAMAEEERVFWCRNKGVFAHHLERWKKDAIALLTPNRVHSKSKETMRLKKENAALKKELSRKDKALAETAALLVLKKKSRLSLGGSQGRLISQEDKKEALGLIQEACEAGARKCLAAGLLCLPLRTVQRWERHGFADHRKGSRAVPANKISNAEREQIIEVLTSPEFGDSNPNQIVPKLADQGVYLSSESTMYRLLREMNINKHRLTSQPAARIRPEAYIATGPNQLWSWDITYLPTSVKGSFFYLYMIMDVYSRKAVGYQVYECESGELAADLITDACNQEHVLKDQLVLHSDNGGPMKAFTMLAKLQDLGVMPSFSRPRVSNDNPYSESLFRTVKYRPEYPEHPFKDLNNAREWVEGFANWYNNEHLHSGIRFVTPADRHDEKDTEILTKRHQVYMEAKGRHPERWQGITRNWHHIGEVALNRRNN